ncbi:TetR/AcrR family transcriptional regulator [Acidovorax sp.]|uniref:TetR/AcrR family transcriptional regulator n=1 Tax=Acidovorax sp. TaxID=1872122 RepID=UPI00391C8EF8
MPPAPPPARLTDRKRDAIVQAAVAEFREHGFNGTSMDRVAAAADVSKRTVYNHFPSKEELFEAILEQLWDRSQSLEDPAYDAARPLRVQLLQVLEQKMQLLNDASFIDLSRVAMAEIMRSPERAQAMAERLAEKDDGLPRWMRAAQKDGRLRPNADAQRAAHQLHGLVKAFAFWPQVAMGRPALAVAQQQKVLADAVDMFLAYYAVEAVPPAAEAARPATKRKR